MVVSFSVLEGLAPVVVMAVLLPMAVLPGVSTGLVVSVLVRSSSIVVSRPVLRVLLTPVVVMTILLPVVAFVAISKGLLVLMLVPLPCAVTAGCVVVVDIDATGLVVISTTTVMPVSFNVVETLPVLEFMVVVLTVSVLGMLSLLAVHPHGHHHHHPVQDAASLFASSSVGPPVEDISTHSVVEGTSL
jgi:hypothetical protein